jgi:hypothetical protein
MANPAQQLPTDRPGREAKMFADLWRRKERAARVAELLEARRKRRDEQTLRAQRQRSTHPAR